MKNFTRAELEKMMELWLDVNDRAEQQGNWRIVADYFTEDCIYGWDTPNGAYRFKGREQIRKTCVGEAMDPYQGWTYPYDKIVIDEKKGEVFVTWWQIPPGAPRNEDGSEMKVMGASWFKYAGNYMWSEQMDMYDYTQITDLIKKCVALGILKKMPTMSAEMVK